jgi:hypothetical protein
MGREKASLSSQPFKFACTAVADRGGGFAAWLVAVKATMDFLPQLFGFGGIIGIRHALRQFGQLVAGKLTFASQFRSGLNHSSRLVSASVHTSKKTQVTARTS